jgi:hypothetical protein
VKRGKIIISMTVAIVGAIMIRILAIAAASRKGSTDKPD